MIETNWMNFGHCWVLGFLVGVLSSMFYSVIEVCFIKRKKLLFFFFQAVLFKSMIDSQFFLPHEET